ncbi:MAG: dimethylsulfonioproprionate lyase family protein [Pseudomonadota bacterium]
MPDQSLYKLRDAVRDYARSQAPDIQSFCGDALFEDHDTQEIEVRTLAVVDKIGVLGDHCSPATQSLFDAVIAAAPHLYWQHSYTPEDDGIDQYYLDNSGWFNLIAPSGPFLSEKIRVSIGFWNKGLVYPNHWHEPEEIYLTIAGSAQYISHGRMAVRGGPGTTICHYSNQPHSAVFDEAPLLAAAFWRGDNLERKSVIEAQR